jgi:hypothetical protein
MLDFLFFVFFNEGTMLVKSLKILLLYCGQRFLPSEFGMDPATMEHALAPGRETFDQKMIVRKAIEDAKIPFTYVSANCFAGYFVGSLCQLETLTPPKDKVRLYGDGNVKGK